MLLTSQPFNRRKFLATAGGALAVAAGLPALAEETKEDPYRGFKMGIQSYSLRHFDFEEAMTLSQKLGLKYWESFSKHIGISAVPKYVAEKKEQLAKHDIQLVAYGVVPFDENENAARTIFEFARSIGIRSLSADPKKSKETFDLLDKLVEEYKVNVAIHNHGPGAKYDKISDVVTWVKDRHPGIGACVDTGHYLRSNESPVEAMQQLKGRVFGVHLKDVKDINGQKVFKIIGEGDLDIPGCLKELKAQKYDYCLALEYEESVENPVPDLEICLQHVKTAMQTLK